MLYIFDLESASCQF